MTSVAHLSPHTFRRLWKWTHFVLHRLTDAGNTVIVIEHNLDVIKTADWILDLGPERGATLVATSAPKELLKRLGEPSG